MKVLSSVMVALSCALNACKPADNTSLAAEASDFPTGDAVAAGVGPPPEAWAHIAPAPSVDDRKRFDHLPSFGFGTPASAEHIARWDIDVMPDGTGLPPGRGSVAEGKTLYAMQCVQCHGARGEGADYDVLVGREPRDGFPFGSNPELKPTVGNYWPYATSLFDYVQRAMPQAVPGSLPPDDVYSIVAYLLYLNEIVPEDGILDRDSLPLVEMPARDRFVVDDREDGPEIR